MIKIPLSAYAEAYVSSMPKGQDPVGALQRIQHAMTAAPELASYVASPAIPETDRLNAIEIAAPDVPVETRRFVLLLARAKLMKRFERISALVREAAANARGESVIAVTSAVPLIDKERKDITHILEARTGTHVSLSERIDPSVKGGILVQLGDWEFDATVAGRIRRLNNAINTV